MLEEYSTRPNNFNKDSTEGIRALLNNPKQTAQALSSTARRTFDAVQIEWDVINEDMHRPLKNKPKLPLKIKQITAQFRHSGRYRNTCKTEYEIEIIYQSDVIWHALDR